jgi:esterase
MNHHALAWNSNPQSPIRNPQSQMLHLNYKSYGHGGHPVVILHGLLGMLDNWQTQSKKLAENHFKVFALDQRNHGKSPHSDTFNYEVMASDVLDFMRQHHLSSAHVLGHSMGGKTAMQFALTHPECSLKLREFKERAEVDAELAKRLPEFSLRQFILKNLMRTDAGEFKWKVNLSIIKRHYPEIANDIPAHGQFDKPTLFIKGGRSRYILKSDEAHIHKLFPSAKIETIANAGHWIHADAAEEFGGIVISFLSNVARFN